MRSQDRLLRLDERAAAAAGVVRIIKSVLLHVVHGTERQWRIDLGEDSETVWQVAAQLVRVDEWVVEMISWTVKKERTIPHHDAVVVVVAIGVLLSLIRQVYLTGFLGI